MAGLWAFLRRFGLLGLLAVFLPVPATAEVPDTRPAALDDGWAVAEPAEAGLDADVLAGLAEMVTSGVTVPNVHAVLIEHRGRLVYEQYLPGEDQSFTRPLGYIEHGPGTHHDIRSITKSVTSLLLGIALGEMADDALARPIASFFPDREALGAGLDQVTLHHVLTMTAGLPWNEMYVPPSSSRSDVIQLLDSEDPIGAMLARDVRDTPGTKWTYNSGLTLLAAGVIENVTGEPLEAFARRVLFGPLGITDYEWLKSPAWPADAPPSASAGLRMRARDLAKIGSLVLQQGAWQGRQVVPAAWIAASTTRHVQDNPWGPPGVYGYGYQWYPGTLLTGQKVVRASGWGDQRIFVLPEAGLSVTIFAGNYDACCRAVGERLLARIVRAMP